MKFEELAWNNFYKTGDIQSYLEYRKFNMNHFKNFTPQNNNEQIIQNLGVMINEINKSQGDCDKGSPI